MNKKIKDKELRIMESARSFFFRYGYKKTSMDEIAEDVGIAKGSLYNYFKNKEDLFIQVGEAKRIEILAKLLKKKKLVERADEMMINLMIYMVNDIKFMIKEYAMSKTVIEELVITGMDLMGDHPEFIIQTADIIREGINQGIFKEVNPLEKANVMNRFMKLFFLPWLMMDPEEAETEIREMHELIFDGLRK